MIIRFPFHYIFSFSFQVMRVHLAIVNVMIDQFKALHGVQEIEETHFEPEKLRILSRMRAGIHHQVVKMPASLIRDGVSSRLPFMLYYLILFRRSYDEPLLF